VEAGHDRLIQLVAVQGCGFTLTFVKVERDAVVLIASSGTLSRPAQGSQPALKPSLLNFTSFSNHHYHQFDVPCRVTV
jgi:hypothetical protein